MEKYRKDLVTLIILDGLGVVKDEYGNAVLQAKTPFLDTVWSKGVSTLIEPSGIAVGLPPEEPGNSEVGHLNIGCGQVVYQSLPKINDAINSGKFGTLPVVVQAFDEVKKRKSNLHIMGILSAGGVHGHIEHLFTMLEICKDNGIDPYVHAFMDGRDTGLTDGYFYVSKLIQKFKELGVGHLASMSGRFFSMDRDNRWERIQQGYECMVGKGKRTAKDPFAVLQEAYKKGENDQIFTPTTILNAEGFPVGKISDNDVVLFYNYREDRSREMTKVFVQPEFDKFERANFPKNTFFVTMTGYADELSTNIIFKPKKIESTLASVLADNKLKQLHVSETEKFAHVTYFFNGGVEKLHEGEKHYNIPSPKVFDYSQTPEMSAPAITDQVMYELNNQAKSKNSFILINYANPDMLGHTGNIDATIKANQITDAETKKIVEKTLEVGGAAIIIADHGNCETMIDRVTNKIDTMHNNSPVPFIFVYDKSQIQVKAGEKLERIGLGERGISTGILADVAPTVLAVLGLEKPASMTGINLLEVI